MFPNFPDWLAIPCFVLLGAIFIMLIYHFLLYLQYRDRVILKYCLYLLAIGLYLLADVNTRINHIPGLFTKNELLSDAFNFIAILTYAGFVIETLPVSRERYRVLFAIWKGVSWATILYVLFCCALYIRGPQGFESAINLMNNFFRIIFVIVGVVAATAFFSMMKTRFLQWIKWGAISYLFFMAIVMYVVLVPNDRLLFGLSPMHYVYIGTLSDVIIFSVAMSFKIKELVIKVTEIRNRLSRDLHDDIGATLTSISFLSEVARQPNQAEAEKTKALDKIGLYSREMIEGMSDIVWAINPQNDRVAKITDRMKNFAQTLLSAKNIAFHFQADEELNEITLNMQQRRNLFLVFKEAVNNAAKYSDCSNLEVSILGEDHSIRMQVKDDGKGFDQGVSTNGNGITNMQQRAQEINGIFRMVSEKGAGTSIDLSFSVTQNA
jgi:signal transduction histidine kinase